MSGTPSWLQPSGNDAPAPAATAAPASLEVTGTTNFSQTAATPSTQEEEKDLPSIILMMRLINMGMAAALITISVSSVCLRVKWGVDGRDRIF